MLRTGARQLVAATAGARRLNATTTTKKVWDGRAKTGAQAFKKAPPGGAAAKAVRAARHAPDSRPGHSEATGGAGRPRSDPHQAPPAPLVGRQVAVPGGLDVYGHLDVGSIAPTVGPRLAGVHCCVTLFHASSRNCVFLGRIRTNSSFCDRPTLTMSPAINSSLGMGLHRLFR